MFYIILSTTYDAWQLPPDNASGSITTMSQNPLLYRNSRNRNPGQAVRNAVLERSRWGVPFEVDDKLSEMLSEKFESTARLWTDDSAVREAWSVFDEQGDVVSLELFLVMIRTPSNLPNDDRIFDGMSYKKPELFISADITVGEIVFVMQRYASILCHSGFMPNGHRGGSFKLIEQDIKVVREMVPEHEALAWVLALRLLKSGHKGLTDLAQLVIDNGYGFEDIARVINGGVLSRKQFEMAVLHGIDTQLILSVA